MIEIVGVAGGKIYARVTEFTLTVDLGAPDVLDFCNYSAVVSAGLVAEVVAQGQIVASGFNKVAQLFRPCLRRHISAGLW